MRQIKLTDLRRHLSKTTESLKDHGIMVVQNFMRTDMSFVMMNIDDYAKIDPSILDYKKQFEKELSEKNSKANKSRFGRNKVK